MAGMHDQPIPSRVLGGTLLVSMATILLAGGACTALSSSAPDNAML